MFETRGRAISFDTTVIPVPASIADASVIVERHPSQRVGGCVAYPMLGTVIRADVRQMILAQITRVTLFTVTLEIGAGAMKRTVEGADDLKTLHTRVRVRAVARRLTEGVPTA